MFDPRPPACLQSTGSFRPLPRAPGPCRASGPRTAWALGTGALILLCIGPFHRAPAATPQASPATQSGLRVLHSRHLSLVTDLPASPAVDELPAVFDLAVPQWAAYFQVDAARLNAWQVTACLMTDKSRFIAAGLLPDDLPEFPFAFQRGRQLWVYHQPSDYYQRHLLLHEGTHAVMLELLGGTGPPWYMEGMAELLATHRWQDGQLQIGFFPQHRDQTPLWGRIKLVRDHVDGGTPLSLQEIFSFGPRTHQQVDAYGWCWAACMLLDRHPEFHEAFRGLHKLADAPSKEFVRQAQKLLENSHGRMELAWQAMLSDLEYGYDVPQGALSAAATEPLSAGGWRITLAADRSWQKTAISIEASTEYQIAARGRYVVAQAGGPWECEPQGVTIRYYRGRPLGELSAAVVPDDLAANPTQRSPWLDPIPIGRRARFRAPTSGTLYLRINEMPGDLDDNRGSIQVGVRPSAAVSGD